MITANGRSLSCVTAYAFSAAANTDAPSTAAGIASTPHHEGTPPRIARHDQEHGGRQQDTQTHPQHVAGEQRRPRPTGVATAAW